MKPSRDLFRGCAERIDVFIKHMRIDENTPPLDYVRACLEMHMDGWLAILCLFQEYFSHIRAIGDL